MRPGGRLLAALLVGAAACSNSGGDLDAGSVATTTDDEASAPECESPRPAAAGTAERALAFDGDERQYLLTIPASYDGVQPAPVVVNLHGFGSNAGDQNDGTGMPERAGARGYMVVAPEGGPLAIPGFVAPGADGTGDLEGRAFWNLFGEGDVDFGPPNGVNLGIDSSEVGADDVGFVGALLDELVADLCVDPDRLYATGMSNGAGMASTLGCFLGDRFAAIAPVAGVNLTGKCPGEAPVSVRAVHGDVDSVVLYGGNGVLDLQFGNPSVPERMTQWAERGDCAVDPVREEPEPGLIVERWLGCADGVAVELWTIAGWDHFWPRATPTDPTGVIDATEVVLDFFDAHPHLKRSGEAGADVGAELALGDLAARRAWDLVDNHEVLG